MDFYALHEVVVAAIRREDRPGATTLSLLVNAGARLLLYDEIEQTQGLRLLIESTLADLEAPPSALEDAREFAQAQGGALMDSLPGAYLLLASTGAIFPILWHGERWMARVLQHTIGRYVRLDLWTATHSIITQVVRYDDFRVLNRAERDKE